MGTADLKAKVAISTTVITFKLIHFHSVEKTLPEKSA